MIKQGGKGLFHLTACSPLCSGKSGQGLKQRTWRSTAHWLLPPHSCYCPWWSALGTILSDGVFTATGLELYRYPLLLRDAKSQFLSMISSFLGLPLQVELHLHQWHLLAWPSGKLQVLFRTPSCLQNQHHLVNPYAYQIQLPVEATALGSSLS